MQEPNYSKSHTSLYTNDVLVNESSECCDALIKPGQQNAHCCFLTSNQQTEGGWRKVLVVLCALSLILLGVGYTGIISYVSTKQTCNCIKVGTLFHSFWEVLAFDASYFLSTSLLWTQQNDLSYHRQTDFFVRVHFTSGFS